MVPGGTVQTKVFSTNQKGLGTNSNLLRNARWNLHFSCMLTTGNKPVLCMLGLLSTIITDQGEGAI